ncbi:peptidoglycan-binding protein [Streptomyces sp. MZ04]|uniref:peptidoglycan-binding protein n=1 Tax=Streptomyces sp. MZ04 TaxID=2559236 RepID=UPI00107E7E14|nr:peptidoglycan-binding protein [Streptomyces sp. MZ04]TGB05686.1 efflux RND transporter periplasmic adaptor subunit [Streptomyces sp. MZ04]
MSGATKKRRRAAGRAALVGAAVLAVGAGVVAATGIGFSSGDKAKAPHSTLPPATVKVTERTLLDTQTESGKLSYGDSTTLVGKLSGTVTSLPTPGSTIRKGQELYRVDNTPVVLMYGKLPTYRALTVGTEGADVKQFERNLWDLGYRGFTVDNEYTEATATAVKKWQKAIGLPESARTGTVDLGHVAYVLDAVRVDTVTASLGDAAKPGDAVLTHTGTVRGATVELAVSDVRLAVKGAAVTVKLPDGKTVKGKITDTRSKVSDSDSGNGSGSGSGNGSGGDDSSSSETKILVTIAFAGKKAVSGFDQATVDIGFTASKRENVLTVPVSALLTLAEGGYGVEVVDGRTTRTVAVKTGLFANGRVEISGDGVSEGMKVGVPA